MKPIYRNFDVITEKEDLKHLCTLKNFPVFLGCTDEPAENDLMFDMNWYISENSGCVQMNPVLPLELVYMNQHESSSIGEVWKQHHKQFAQFIYDSIRDFGNTQVNNILEIGGGSGILSREYMQLDKNASWIILEPNPFPAENVTARYIKSFMDENFVPDINYDLVIHSHTWEHLYEPRKFIKNISGFMQEGSLQIFSIPNMKIWEERRYTSFLNFEHNYMLNEEYCEYILNEFGYSLLNKHDFHNGHSIFYVFKKTSALKNNNNILKGCINSETKNFTDYCNYFQDKVVKLNDKLSRCNNPIYLFGGHIMSQYLLALGLDNSENMKIASILDNAPGKQGKRLYGSRLYVHSPKILRDINNPVVILIDNPYSQEIKNDILNNINDSVVFWE